MNRTIEYYDRNAEEYCRNTADADFDRLRREFASHLPEHARILDVGCGSGRDVKAFRGMGYEAAGLDASRQLAAEAKRQLGIEVIIADMSEWIAEEPYDGIWCCASLLHLREEEADRFLRNLRYNLKEGGVLFLSVKEGIGAGYDEKGRFMRYFTEEELRKKLAAAGITVISAERTEDQLGRAGLRWLNLTGLRKQAE